MCQACWATPTASSRSRTATRAAWSIRSTPGHAYFAIWPFPRCWSAAIMAPWPGGDTNNPWPAAARVRSRSARTKESIMQNKLMALVENAALRKDVEDFQIGDQIEVHQRILEGQ